MGLLKELIIRDFAIIDSLELGFGPGLTCLTGETGAGKSILVDAISALLGGRAGPEYLRDGRDAVLEAGFDVSGMPDLTARLEGLGFGGDGGLILKRVLSSGRGRAYINGSLASLGMLQEVGDSLVDLHGQHEHQSLLRVDTHMGLLDSFCGLGGRVRAYAEAYAALQGLKKKLGESRGRERERAQRLDLIRFQIGEISAAALMPGEEGPLAAERARLLHADRLRSLIGGAIENLSGAEQSALALIAASRKAATEVAQLVPGQDECVRLMESAEVTAKEACLRLRDLGDSLDPDPERLGEVEARLDLVSKLKKKYGETLEAVIGYGESLEREMSEMENADSDIAEAESKVKALESDILDTARSLGAEREEGAKAFSEKVEAELAGLGMDKARFGVSLTRLDAPGPRGLDKAEFLISANPGEAMKPLAKVASGGELSRVMLALKVVLSGADRVPTLIFDEVDSGVGGSTAETVGRKLREAAAGRQVFCITHLPQIASLAEEHYRVEKSFEDGKTRVAVLRLGKEERVGEIARMLGGKGSKTASAHAAELVRRGGL